MNMGRPGLIDQAGFMLHTLNKCIAGPVQDRHFPDGLNDIMLLLLRTKAVPFLTALPGGDGREPHPLHPSQKDSIQKLGMQQPRSNLRSHGSNPISGWAPGNRPQPFLPHSSIFILDSLCKLLAFATETCSKT